MEDRLRQMEEEQRKQQEEATKKSSVSTKQLCLLRYLLAERIYIAGHYITLKFEYNLLHCDICLSATVIVPMFVCRCIDGRYVKMLCRRK